MSTGAAELDIRTASVARNPIHIRIDSIHLATLLVDDMSHIPEQFIQFTNALLDVPDLGLPLNDQSLLEVDLLLVRQTRPLLLQQLLLLLALCILARVLSVVECRTGRNRGCPLLLQSAALDGLEFLQSGFELGR